MNIKRFVPNELPKKEIREYLETVREILHKEVDESLCHSRGCRKCPFYNLSCKKFISRNEEICLTDYFRDSDKVATKRFLYAYNYYMENFVSKHKQEEMDV